MMRTRNNRRGNKNRARQGIGKQQNRAGGISSGSRAGNGLNGNDKKMAKSSFSLPGIAAAVIFGILFLEPTLDLIEEIFGITIDE